MTRRRILCKTFMLVLMVAAVCMMSVGIGAAAVITVDDSGGADYTTMQAAIDAAAAGDTIEVHSGTYYENVNVNKQLTLRGIDTGTGMPVVDARLLGSAIALNANGITLEGFMAINASSYPNAGIKVISSNNTISNNVASNNNIGIHLQYSSSNRLIGNTASNNNNTAYSGIWLSFSSNNNTLIGNTASNNLNGIWLSSSSNNNTLNGNTVSNNFHNGIFLTTSCNNNTLIDNTASNNLNGIHIQYSSSNTLIGNTVSNNIYSGIYLYSSSNNNLYHNNLADNTNNAKDDRNNQWDSGAEGNYYSDYTGIGNTPYPITGGSSVDRYPLINPYTDEPATYQDFTFAHISDVHIGYDATNEDDYYEFKGTRFENGLPINRILRFAETLWQISNENPKPKFLLVTGDDAHYSNEHFFTTFTALLNMNSIPYYNIAGNHDSSLCTQQNQGCSEDDILSNYSEYVTEYNDFAFNYEDYRFIGLYSGKSINGQYELSGLNVGQLENLENNLGDNSKKQVIFTHAPVTNLNQTTRDRFKSYTMANNVEMVLSGHMHFDEILDVNENIIDENNPERPLFVTTRSATLSGKTYDGYDKGPAHTDAYGYRIFNADKDGIAPHPSTETLSLTELIFMVFSPVDIQIYDSQNRKTGMDENGIEYGIPDSYYIKGYENENITIPQIIWIHNTSDSYRLEITSNFTKQQIKQSVDSFNLTIRKEMNGSFMDINYYNVEIENNTISSVIINYSSTNPIFNIDIDGDGIDDTTRKPDEIIDNTPPSIITGDVNGDGILTSVDALMALQMSAGNIAEDLAADVSGDGSVTSLDALMILQASVGAIVL